MASKASGSGKPPASRGEPPAGPGRPPAEPGKPPGPLRRAAGKLAGVRTRQTIGMVVLLAVVAVVVAALFLGVQRSRANYFEQRNLRELDRVAANISSTSQTLGSVASLYFNPQQLHFSLTPDSECLMASTRIQRTADLSIDIAYYFVDQETPSGAPQGDAKDKADPETAAPGKDGKIAQAPAARSGPAPAARMRCPFDEPLRNVAGGEKLAIDGERISLSEWLLMRDLVRPMVAAAAADPAALASQVMKDEAARRIERGGFGPLPDDVLPAVVSDSIETAFRRNAVRTEVSVSTAALDLDTSLETFDAIQILGTGDSGSLSLLFQAGQLPPAVTTSDGGSGRDFLQTILKASGDSAASTGAAKSKRAYQANEGGGNLLIQSRVYPAEDLMIFDKGYARLGGFPCSTAKPCRVIGIIQNKRFGSDVRKFEGMDSTAFLIAVLTLVGLLPMIHLALRKRLDAIGWGVQYVMWFSLTLLAASAVIASLTVWAGGISKTKSSAYAESEIGRIKAAFDTELVASLRLITELGGRLQPSETAFPAPAAIHWAEPDRRGGRDSAILDTTAYFRGDGYAARDLQRFSDLRMPPFGLNIADRDYFLRTRSGNYPRICLSGKKPCDREAEGLEFAIDRVVARPDGVAKTIFLLPEQKGHVEPPTSPRPAAGAADDPARPQLLLASGYLQTFVGASVRPGFHYAVIDLNRPEGEPDILFSNRRSAELAEEFERDLDDRESFRTVSDQIRFNPQAGVRRLATHYRGDPVRLTLAKLHDDVDWMLVMIEGRNDSGFAVWRAATFGFSTWLFTILLISIINGLVRLWRKEAQDRRPGLWLWPVDVLTDFTPPRFETEALRRELFKKAADRRDGHVRLALIAGAVGVLAGEGASRTLLALAVVMIAFAARAYFKGLTACEREAGRKVDRLFILLGWFFLILSAVIFGLIAFGGQYPADSIAGQLPRILLYVGSVLVLAKLLVDARREVQEKEGRRSLPVMVFDSLRRRLRKALRKAEPAQAKAEHRRERRAQSAAAAKDRRPRRGWMAFLMAIGTLPAAAGFLDSIDHDSTLVAERVADRDSFDARRRTENLDSIGVGRTGALPRAQIDRLTRGALPGEQDPPGAERDPPERLGKDGTIADVSMRAIDLHQTALSFSDFRPFHMRDGFSAALQSPWIKTLIALLVLLAPFALLYGAFYLFRRQYFTQPPRTPAISREDFTPPLTCARSDFLASVLIPVASGGDPKVPFEKDPSQRHLILGMDLDIEDEPDLKKYRDEIKWVNLLEIAAGAEAPKELDEKVKAVVVGNLDIALQLPDKAQIRTVFDTVKALVDAADLPANKKRHLFILADVAPLDRIAMLRCRDDEEPLSTIEDWRWAALLQDFTLIAVVSTSPEARGVKGRDNSAGESRAECELTVINTVFARALLEQLKASSRHPRNPREKFAYDNRVIDYVAEQMADYYHKLWAASSDEERVLLYHIAWRAHLKMTDGPALRSLLVRGLIVRSPEYRLMNKSFGRYVRRIERLERIRKRAAGVDGIDTIWPVIRIPLIVFTVALLVIVQLISPRHATGALGIVPAMGAIVPALLANWLRMKAAEG